MPDYAHFQSLLTARLEAMQSMLRRLEIPRSAPFAPLLYLHDLIVAPSGRLSGIVVEIVATIGQNRRMTYDLSSDPFRLLVDHRLIDAFDHATPKFGAANLEGVIDAFLIHEFLHYSQGMGGGRYSGLARQSPVTLLAIDYQADALAVVAMTGLNFLRNELDPTLSPADALWNTYLHSIELALGQMEVFTHLILKSMDRDEIAKRPFSLDKFQRTVAWHYQFHRARFFNRQRSLADFQILSQPYIQFRNLEAGWAHDRRLLARTWPSEGEDKLIEIYAHRALCYAALPASDRMESGYSLLGKQEPFCILAAPSPFGTTGFARSQPFEQSEQQELFEGLFEGDLDKSASFFENLFAVNPWLIGAIEGNDPGNPGGDNPLPWRPTGSSGGGVTLETPAEKLEFLNEFLQPSVIPLTTMVQEPA